MKRERPPPRKIGNHFLSLNYTDLMKKKKNSAKKLNKQAARCLEAALANGSITSQSSVRGLLYDISRQWRRLLDATSFASSESRRWSEKEEFAGEVLVSTLTYLEGIGCQDIDDLVEDVISRRFRHTT